MKITILGLMLFLCFQDIPFKPKEEFEIKLNYQFKQRPRADINAVYMDETRRERDKRNSSDVLPYLVLNVRMLKLSEEEVRIRLENNLDSRVVNKKVTEGMILPIDIGFTADVKDRTTAHEYKLTFLSPKKSNVSKVIIFVDEDGTFLVNGEKRGKF